MENLSSEELNNVVIDMSNISEGVMSIADINRVFEYSKNYDLDIQIESLLKDLTLLGASKNEDIIKEKMSIYKELKDIHKLKMDKEEKEMNSMNFIEKDMRNCKYFERKLNYINHLNSIIRRYDMYIQYLKSKLD